MLLVEQRSRSLIDILNHAQRIGLLRNAQDRLTWRNLRNQLIHEYMESPEDFANALNAANEYSGELRRSGTTRRWLENHRPGRGMVGVISNLMR
jgi:hypothetical protein